MNKEDNVFYFLKIGYDYKTHDQGFHDGKHSIPGNLLRNTLYSIPKLEYTFHIPKTLFFHQFIYSVNFQTVIKKIMHFVVFKNCFWVNVLTFSYAPIYFLCFENRK